MKTCSLALAAGALALAAASFAATAADHAFSNTSSITINDNAVANPYPSTVNVTGLGGSVDNVRVSLHGISHTWIGDLNILLVAPGGQKIALMQRVGMAPTAGTSVCCGTSADFVNAEVTFSASAASTITGSPVPSGTYLPTAGNTLYNSPAPAPAGPYSTDLTTLDGSGTTLNGTWQLFINDGAAGDTGSVAGGWTLTFADAQSCASEGYTGTKLEWCKNICERGYTGATLDMWIRRWTDRYRTLPYCAIEPQPE
jgi:subtilisin-like proprotein convertase family protein